MQSGEEGEETGERSGREFCFLQGGPALRSESKHARIFIGNTAENLNRLSYGGGATFTRVCRADFSSSVPEDRRECVQDLATIPPPTAAACSLFSFFLVLFHLLAFDRSFTSLVLSLSSPRDRTLATDSSPGSYDGRHVFENEYVRYFSRDLGEPLRRSWARTFPF